MNQNTDTPFLNALKAFLDTLISHRLAQTACDNHLNNTGIQNILVLDLDKPTNLWEHSPESGHNTIAQTRFQNDLKTAWTQVNTAWNRLTGTDIPLRCWHSFSFGFLIKWTPNPSTGEWGVFPSNLDTEEPPMPAHWTPLQRHAQHLLDWGRVAETRLQTLDTPILTNSERDSPLWWAYHVSPVPPKP